MKIEIDLSNPAQIKAMRDEFLLAVSLCESALGKIGNAPNSPLRSPETEDASVADFIARLPDQFDMKTAISSGESAGINSTKLRREIKRQEESKQLFLHVPGQGRRPAVYRKIKESEKAN